MEILNSKQDSIRAKTLRAKHVKVDCKSIIQTAGTVVAIPLVNWQEIVADYGGLDNLTFPDVPAEAEYEVQVTERYRAAAHPDELCLYEAGSIVSFMREQAVRLMLNAGMIRPVDKGTPDLSVFCSFRYRFDRSGPGGKTAVEQQRERLLHERFQAFQEGMKERLSWIKGRRK